MAEERKEPAEQEMASEEVVKGASEQTETEEPAAAEGEAAECEAQETETPDTEEGENTEAETGGDGEDGGAENNDPAKESGDGKTAKGEKGSWGFGFGKNKKDDKKDQQIAELNDKVKRQMAEFDNYRKRTEKEKSAMFEIGAKSVLEKLLPIVDNFERGLAAIPEEEKDSATAVGMDKIYKQLIKAMEEMDVKPIEAVGKEFSPDFHNAVMQAEVEGVDENIIVEEFQKGYLYRGSVLRHSMVKVNK